MFFLAVYSVVVLGLVNQVLSLAAACNKAPYDVFNFLSAVPAAEAFCTAHFPPLQCIKTVSSTYTIHSTMTTSLVVATATATTSVVSITSYTSTSTSTVFTGTTVVNSITGTDTTMTTDSTATITSTISTSTTTVAGGTTSVTQTSDIYLPAALKARDTDKALGPREPTTFATTTTKAATNPVSALLSSLESKASAFISTVCSCIEATPSCGTTTSIATVTSTSTPTASVTTTISVQGTTTVFIVSTITTSIESTSIMDLAATTTVTVIASTTLDVVATSTVTSTSTVTQSATRTYTQVYGPTSEYIYIDDYVSSYTFGGDPSTINTQCGSVCDSFRNCVAFFTDLNAGTKECFLLSSTFSASKLEYAGTSISEDYAYNVLS